ncbi:MAG: DUF2946 family protein [Pseudomonadota bacterium]
MTHTRLTFRLLALLLALFAYAVNGAQARVAVTPGETLSVPICSLHGDITYMTIDVGGGGPPGEPTHTHCEACTIAAAVPSAPPARLTAPAGHTIGLGSPAAPQVHPSSPLWPGAPPQGPPTARKA